MPTLGSNPRRPTNLYFMNKALDIIKLDMGPEFATMLKSEEYREQLILMILSKMYPNGTTEEQYERLRTEVLAQIEYLIT